MISMHSSSIFLEAKCYFSGKLQCRLWRTWRSRVIHPNVQTTVVGYRYGILEYQMLVVMFWSQKDADSPSIPVSRRRLDEYRLSILRTDPTAKPKRSLPILDSIPRHFFPFFCDECFTCRWASEIQRETQGTCRQTVARSAIPVGHGQRKIEDIIGILLSIFSNSGNVLFPICRSDVWIKSWEKKSTASYIVSILKIWRHHDSVQSSSLWLSFSLVAQYFEDMTKRRQLIAQFHCLVIFLLGFESGSRVARQPEQEFRTTPFEAEQYPLFLRKPPFSSIDYRWRSRLWRVLAGIHPWRVMGRE